MSGSLNKAMIIGTLGKDPEIRQTPGGKRVANFSVATNESYRDKNGDNQKSTEWHRLVAWGRLVDVIEKYLRKGSTAYFEGKITTRSWDDPQSGQKKYSTEIVVYSMQLLGGKPASQGNSQGNQGGPPQGPDDDLPF